MTPQELASAEEWRVKYEIVCRAISDPAVIENAERAARIVMDLATSGIYPLPVCAELVISLIHRFYVEEAALAQQGATAMLDELARAATKGRS